MATDDRQVLVTGTAPAPADWTVPGNGQIRPKTVYAEFDGSGASVAYTPALKIFSDGGELIGIYISDVSVAAGGSVAATWFPGVDVDEPETASSSGIELLSSPNGTVTVTNPSGPAAGVDLPVTGVTAATYGDSGHVSQVTVDAEGRVTTAANVAIASGGTISDITSTGGTITVGSPTGPTTNVDLPTTGVSAGTYGDGTHVGQVTVDAEGRVTAASSVLISAGVAPLGVTYVGYNTIGATAEGNSASTIKLLAKQITVATDSLLTSIDVYTKGNANNVASLIGAVLADNAGAPGVVQGLGGFAPGEPSGSLMINLLMTTTARWLSIPVSTWLVAGTYWLVVGFGSTNANVITVFRDGSGSDKTVAAYNATWVNFDGQTWVAGTNKYSIRGALVQT